MLKRRQNKKAEFHLELQELTLYHYFVTVLMFKDITSKQTA